MIATENVSARSVTTDLLYRVQARDEERFTEYLADVKAGKKTINAGALKPHELVEEVMRCDMCALQIPALLDLPCRLHQCFKHLARALPHRQCLQKLLPSVRSARPGHAPKHTCARAGCSDSAVRRSEPLLIAQCGTCNALSRPPDLKRMHSLGRSEGDLSLETVEGQWKAYVVKLRESGALSSALAIADVSGSMAGTPMNVRASMEPASSTCVFLCMPAFR